VLVLFGVGALSHQIVNAGIVGKLVIVPGFVAGELEDGFSEVAADEAVWNFAGSGKIHWLVEQVGYGFYWVSVSYSAVEVRGDFQPDYLAAIGGQSVQPGGVALAGVPFAVLPIFVHVKAPFLC
jgi:hypothetical protein